MKMEKRKHYPSCSPVLPLFHSPFFPKVGGLACAQCGRPERRVRILVVISTTVWRRNNTQMDITGRFCLYFSVRSWDSAGHIFESFSLCVVLSVSDYSLHRTGWPASETGLFLRHPLGETKVRMSCFWAPKRWDVRPAFFYTACCTLQAQTGSMGHPRPHPKWCTKPS